MKQKYNHKNKWGYYNAQITPLPLKEFCNTVFTKMAVVAGFFTIFFFEKRYITTIQREGVRLYTLWKKK